jgi:glutamate dehydrogenase
VEVGKIAQQDGACGQFEIDLGVTRGPRDGILKPRPHFRQPVQVRHSLPRPVTDVGRVYFALGARLGLDWLRAAAEERRSDDHWERLAITAVVEDLFGQQRALALAALTSANGDDPVAAWSKRHEDSIARCNELIDDLKAAGSLSVAKLTYANRRIRSLISD